MRGRGGGIGAAIVVVLTMAFVVGSIVRHEMERRSWLQQVRAGGGEVRFLATHMRCQGFPHLARAARRGTHSVPVSFGTRVEVVAQENGWALIDRYGNPCWVPLWSLSRDAPDMRAAVRCGMACHRRPPPGWREAQRQAACAYGWKLKLDCFLDELTGRDGFRR